MGNSRQCGNAVMQPGGQLWKQCKLCHLRTQFATDASDQIRNQSKLCHLVTKYATNTSGAIWWPKVEPMPIALDLKTILVAAPGGQTLN